MVSHMLDGQKKKKSQKSKKVKKKSKSHVDVYSLAVSTQDSPAVEPRSNPDSGKILMSENLRLYTTSPVVMC